MPSGLASHLIWLLLCDEVDRYPFSAGAEGDPVNLTKKRTMTFWNRKIVLVSTLTNKGASRIEAAFEESDQRRFQVPCPQCGAEQILSWPQVRWDKGRDGSYRPETAVCRGESPNTADMLLYARGEDLGGRLAANNMKQFPVALRRTLCE